VLRRRIGSASISAIPGECFKGKSFPLAWNRLILGQGDAPGDALMTAPGRRLLNQ